MKLELKEKNWKILFDCIRNSNIKSEGNFWALIQYLERQYYEEIEREEMEKSIYILNEK